mgnify:CR=1 FL=1
MNTHQTTKECLIRNFQEQLDSEETLHHQIIVHYSTSQQT